jgi:hypothetical protein
LAAAALAVVVWFAALAVAVLVPGSPFAEMPGVIERLADERTGPAAMDDFQELGGTTALIASTIFPLLAGLAVLAFSVWKLHLRFREVAAVAVLYALFVLLFSGGVRYFGVLELISVVLFTLTAAVAPALSARRSRRA